MSQRMTCRKTYQEKLKPTSAQERALERVLWHCCTLYNTALEQRICLYTYTQRRISVSRSQQEAELKALRADMPAYGAIHSHVRQDVARLDTTYHAFFRRLANGEQPGFPRLHGTDRSHSFTYTEYGNGAWLDTGYLVLSKIGRIAVRWSRPIAGTIKTVTLSHEADEWYVSFCCAEVPVAPLPLTGREPGIDVGLTVLLITAEGEPTANPRHSRTAERALNKAQQRVSERTKGSTRRRTAVLLLAKAQQHVRCLRRQRRDLHHTTALDLVRQYDVVSVEAIQPVNVSRRPAPVQDENGGYVHTGASRKAGLNTSIQDAGWGHFLSLLTCTAAWASMGQHGPAWACKRVDAVPPACTSQDCGTAVGVASAYTSP
jgi:putative transposase